MQCPTQAKGMVSSRAAPHLPSIEGKPSIPTALLSGMEAMGSLVHVPEHKASLAVLMVITVTTITSRQQDARSFGARYPESLKECFPPGGYVPILQKRLR